MPGRATGVGAAARWRPLGVSVATVVGVLVWEQLVDGEGVVERLVVGRGSEGSRGMVRMVDIVDQGEFVCCV